MSTLGRIALAILALHLIGPLPLHAAAAGSTAGDRLLDRESKARVESVHALVRSLIGLDDALIGSGRDDLNRHRRINRLLALDAGWNGTGFDSTAVMAAILDELTRDPDVRGASLFPDLQRARMFALQRLVAGLAATRLPASRDLEVMRRFIEERSADNADSTPVPIPPLPESETPGSVLLEEPVVTVPAPGPVRTLRFLPGSRYVLAGVDPTVPEDLRRRAPDRLFIIDLENGGDAEMISDSLGAVPPTVSASGEYIATSAWKVHSNELRVIPGELRVVRQNALSGPKTVFRCEGSFVDLSFSPRDLKLAAIADPPADDASRAGLTIFDLSDGSQRKLSESRGDLRWSPDGNYLALMTPNLIASGFHLRVFKTDSGEPVVDTEFSGTSPVWYADSRSLTSLPYTPNPDGLPMTIERRTVDGRGPDRVLLFDAQPGAIVEGPAWSPDGQWAALRVSRVADIADGFAESAFLHPSSVVRVVHFDVPDSSGYDPPATYLPEFAWHPSGRWYAARQEFAEGDGLWLHDVLRGDAIRLAGAAATMPAFSPDGQRVLWVERDAIGDRLVYRDLLAVHPNVPKGRGSAAEGARALIRARFEEAARAFRNAIRLSPGEPGALQGLGRALIGAAFTRPFSPRKAAELEAAVRAFARAAEAARTSSEIRVDFLDASGRLAWVQGRLESRRLTEDARILLAAPPPPGEAARRRYAAEVREALVEAILWDPGNEYARILLDGVIARFPAEGS